MNKIYPLVLNKLEPKAQTVNRTSSNEEKALDFSNSATGVQLSQQVTDTSARAVGSEYADIFNIQAFESTSSSNFPPLFLVNQGGEGADRFRVGPVIGGGTITLAGGKLDNSGNPLPDSKADLYEIDLEQQFNFQEGNGKYPKSLSIQLVGDAQDQVKLKAKKGPDGKFKIVEYGENDKRLFQAALEKAQTTNLFDGYWLKGPSGKDGAYTYYYVREVKYPQNTDLATQSGGKIVQVTTDSIPKEQIQFVETLDPLPSP